MYGKANFYAIDPFHEGGNTQGVNLDAAGKAIMKSMKKANPKSVWVIQAWQVNPRPQMIENLEAGDLLVLDLCSECRPQWGAARVGMVSQGWLWSTRLGVLHAANFGGNVGLYGKMDILIDGYYDAKANAKAGKTLKGVGMTPPKASKTIR